MKKGNKIVKTKIKTSSLEMGESIEEKMRRVTNSNEPIENVAPILYTDYKDGVLPQCDPRTDRFEIAQESMDKVSKSYAAKRENAMKQAEQEKKEE